jgi:branched-chain amino acid transport system ATP-binding protein
MTLLEIENLWAGHEGVPVVRGLNLTVDQGEIVALLGPNGAGKTTTLRTVTGMIEKLDGTIIVLGEPVSTRRPHLAARRGLADVPDNRCLFRTLTARQNLTLAGKRSRSNITEILDYFPAIEGLLDRPAGALSGGEQQMLAMARAVLVKPKLLIVDELSLGLAPVIVQRLIGIVRRIAADLAIGVLLVEQHVHLVLDVADRAYVLSHGQLTMHGDASQVTNQIATIESSYLGHSKNN